MEKWWHELDPKEMKRMKVKAGVYFTLRLLVVLVMVAQLFNRNYENVLLCILTLVLFMVPTIINRRLNIELPNTLEIIILLFIFSAEILGEIQEYYLLFPQWDTILHTMNGFLMAAIGFSLIDILNQSERISLKMSPLFLAMVSFCFSMTVGVMWEFFEYGVDCLLHFDMQKDTVISSITSVMLNPDGSNVPVTVQFDSVVINGEVWEGYIDIGLHDTMLDLIVNFIGAVVFNIFGWFYLVGRSEGNFLRRFIPRKKTAEKIQFDKEMEAQMKNHFRSRRLKNVKKR